MSFDVDPTALVTVPLALSQEMVALVITEQAFWAEQFESMWAPAIEQDRFGLVTSYDPGALSPPAGSTAAALTPSTLTTVVEQPDPSYAYVQWSESTTGMLLLTGYFTAVAARWAFAWDEEIAAWAVWSDANVLPVDEDVANSIVVPLRPL